MQILIPTLAASLTVGLVAFGFSADHAQAGCAYQYKHCVARCATRAVARALNPPCVPRCRVALRHCRDSQPASRRADRNALTVQGGRFMRPPQVIRVYASGRDTPGASDSRPRNIRADSRRLAEHPVWGPRGDRLLRAKPSWGRHLSPWASRWGPVIASRVREYPLPSCNRFYGGQPHLLPGTCDSSRVGPSE